MRTFEEFTMLTPADHVPGPKQGKWNYGSYATLPHDGKRYEIIDGVLYMVPAPNDFHQEIVALIISYLIPYIKHTGRGRVLGAPIDVVLEPGTVVQPDVLVLLEEKGTQRKPAQTTRPPDLVIEVASPATAQYDRQGKYYAYARAGVKEYWIVDPVKSEVEVFLLEGNAYHSSGIFRGEQTIPSLIVPDFAITVQRFFA
jgi:Uma2 family endonuclease